MEDFQIQKLLTDIENISKNLEIIASQLTISNQMKARKPSHSNAQFDRKKFNKPFNSKPGYESRNKK
ncbi:hypothetical protein JN01_0194 [Entomoplasma freundtii]|uniref:Uncharacterized protein n=1 Tax=Entomoplasma freundtii TaxID=74700 RepID=A0A2K8NRX2_9MOLU|nr:hypothetical protein [Entomoplasma freundtii]ATZ16595.1 hypothetical protein EFREU_v1c05740 [Entomoplasma freundtii]TDY58239.1 hypothetical protein JN01_0194 [Entomoplasma freundtii]